MAAAEKERKARDAPAETHTAGKNTGQRVLSADAAPARGRRRCPRPTLRVHVSVSTSSPHVLSTSARPVNVPHVHVLASASAPRAALRGGGCERAGRGVSEVFNYQSEEGGHLRRCELGGSQAGVGVPPTTPPPPTLPPWAGILPRVSTWLWDPKAPPACGSATRWQCRLGKVA